MEREDGHQTSSRDRVTSSYRCHQKRDEETAAKMLASRPESLSGIDPSTRHLYCRRDMEVLASNNPLCLISHTGFGPYPPSKIISSVQNPDFEILFPQQMCRKGMMRPRNGQVIMHSPMLFLPPCRITRIVKAATDYIVYIG